MVSTFTSQPQTVFVKDDAEVVQLRCEVKESKHNSNKGRRGKLIIKVVQLRRVRLCG